MKNADLINALTNALGNPHFDPDKVQEQLKEQIDRMAERGENTGSLIALDINQKPRLKRLGKQNDMKYTFSEETKIQLYGKDLYAIMEGEKIVAYSQIKFEIPEEVRFLGVDQCCIFMDAKISGGTFMGGTFWGGTFRGGTFMGGTFMGGTFWGGDFWGGDFSGGTFRGGTFRGGTFRGGDFWGGDYGVTLLQIQGSRHFCYLEKTDEGGLLLGVGCEKHPIDEWKKNYAQIGESESYSPDEIAEYKEYIDLYDRLYQPKKKASKQS